MRLLLAAFLFLSSFTAWAQATLRLTSIPSGTPAGATIYVAGSFNGWNPRLAAYALTPEGNGQYAITLPGTVRGSIQFKFTLGSWDTCEATASGGSASNRTFTVPATGAATYTGTVPAWTARTSTATASVSVMSTTFAMPQLGRTRTIRLYLPPDYATSTKTYPVLYMHDAQNLFDNATSFSGEWGVDEALDQLHAQGDWGCIVVGIDNGGASRINEYSPYVNAQYGGGQGDAYVDFIINTLKPYIDARYRTRPDRLSTGIMGSSMGGLISLYAGLKRPDVFGRVGVFSPSLWFAPRIYSFAKASQPLRPDPRLYLVGGSAESTTQAADQRRMVDTLAAAGYGVGTELDTLIVRGGTHTESWWRQYFPAAYRYLFAGTATALPEPERSTLTLTPNPGPDSNGLLTVQYPGAKGEAELLDYTGKVLVHARLRHGRAELDLGHLPPGVYRVRVGKVVKGWVKRQ